MARPFTLLINYSMLVLLLPVGVDLFEHVGLIFLGEQMVSVHPWLPAAFAYVPVLILLFVYLKATLEPLKNFGFTWNKQFLGTSIIIGVISALVLFLIDMKTGALADFGAIPDPSISVALGFIIAWGFIAPFAEEILFRGLIQTSFMDFWKGGTWFHPAILVASAFEIAMHALVPLFFAAHGTGKAVFLATVPQLLYVALFGIIGGVVYYRTRSLVGPFLIHAIGNIGELVLYWVLI